MAFMAFDALMALSFADDVDTAPPARWAPTDRPVRVPAGVCTDGGGDNGRGKVT
jgi:hypothetical protein